MMKHLLPLFLLSAALALPAEAEPVYAQPPMPIAKGLTSSMSEPEGSDADTYIYEEFVPKTGGTIDRIAWEGSSNAGHDFVVEVLSAQPSVPDSPTPDQTIGRYRLSDGAHQTPTAVSGQFSFHYDLPTPIELQAGQHYWFGIWSVNGGWEWAYGSGGDSSCLLFQIGNPRWTRCPGDRAFTLGR